jgi:hypothetical protein
MDVSSFPVQDRFTFPDASKSKLEAIYEIRNADVGDRRNNDAPLGIGAVREQWTGGQGAIPISSRQHSNSRRPM